VVCRLRARALTPRPKLVKAKSASKAIPRDALRKPRSIQWSKLVKTPVYDGERLAVGNTVKGPAIVETSDTTVVVHPGRTLTVDALGNFEITFK
jgi:N-methylhydantoinase A/oxoprolinase/acetone carboxylase beta subunit